MLEEISRAFHKNRVNIQDNPKLKLGRNYIQQKVVIH